MRRNYIQTGTWLDKPTKRPELVFLGTGGAETTPRVGCLCRVCEEARRKGGRYVRNGPSLFVTRPNLLFDTPDDVAQSLERESVHRVRNLVYTHWHPDHTMGRRVLEQLNMDWLKPKARKMTNVWLPSWVHADFRRMLGLEAHFQHFATMGIARVHEISEGEPLHVDGATLKAFRMAQHGLTSFLLQYGRKRVVLALDDTKGWKPGPELSEPDLLVLETGWFERDMRNRLIVRLESSLRREEASFDETLALIEQVRPRLTILTHIEGLWARSYRDYLRLERKYAKYRLRFAYDGLRIPI